jgi:general stress protein CsbA
MITTNKLVLFTVQTLQYYVNIVRVLLMITTSYVRTHTICIYLTYSPPFFFVLRERDTRDTLVIGPR